MKMRACCGWLYNPLIRNIKREREREREKGGETKTRGVFWVRPTLGR